MSGAASVEGLRPLVEIMAAERTAGRPELYEDAVQEGLVRAWAVLEERPDASRAYVTACARRAIGDVLRGRPAFGAPSHRGRREPLDTATPLVRDDDGDRPTFSREPADARALAELEAVEVRSAVRLAVADLDPEDRDLVLLRYWRDLGFAEASAILGRPAGTLSRRWTEIVRPRLREALAPLAAA